MIKAILFDCNGIIADDEPIHLRLFQQVLKEEGIRLTKKEYFKKYLAMDDRSCFEHALRAHKRPHDPKTVRALIARKAVYYKKVIGKELRIFEGIRSFVKSHRGKYAMAVVSGALRQEILLILKRAGIDKDFKVIISAEDVKSGKPDPECYRKGLQKLNRLPKWRKHPIRPAECVAIEDSIHGVEAAHGAGMKCIAVTNSYSRSKLAHADAVLHSLKNQSLSKLQLG